MHVAPECFISSPTHQSCHKNQTSMTHTVMRRCCQLSGHTTMLLKVCSCIHHSCMYCQGNSQTSIRRMHTPHSMRTPLSSPSVSCQRSNQFWYGRVLSYSLIQCNFIRQAFIHSTQTRSTNESSTAHATCTHVITSCLPTIQ